MANRKGPVPLPGLSDRNERPETMYPEEDNEHLYENNRSLPPSTSKSQPPPPVLPPKGQQAAVSTSGTPHHLPSPPSQQNFTQAAQQSPHPPGYTYPQPTPTGPPGYYPPPQAPYPGQYPPPAGYPGGYPYMAPPPQQQQQQQIVVNNINIGEPTVIVQPAVRARSYGRDIVLACFVFWCCGWLFGGIAFILAVMANSVKYGEESEQLSRASRGVSSAGIVVGIIIIAVIIGVNASASSSSRSRSSRSSSSCNFKYSGICYSHRISCTNSYSCDCSSYYSYANSGSYCYYNG